MSFALSYDLNNVVLFSHGAIGIYSNKQTCTGRGRPLMSSLIGGSCVPCSSKSGINSLLLASVGLAKANPY